MPDVLEHLPPSPLTPPKKKQKHGLLTKKSQNRNLPQLHLVAKPGCCVQSSVKPVVFFDQHRGFNQRKAWKSFNTDNRASSTKKWQVSWNTLETHGKSWTNSEIQGGIQVGKKIHRFLVVQLSMTVVHGLARLLDMAQCPPQDVQENWASRSKSDLVWDMATFMETPILIFSLRCTWTSGTKSECQFTPMLMLIRLVFTNST